MPLLSFTLSAEFMLGPCFSAQWVWFFIWSLPESQTVPGHPMCIHVIAALIHSSFLKHVNFFLSHNFSAPECSSWLFLQVMLSSTSASAWVSPSRAHWLHILLFLWQEFELLGVRHFGFSTQRSWYWACREYCTHRIRAERMEFRFCTCQHVLELFLHIFSIGRR